MNFVRALLVVSIVAGSLADPVSGQAPTERNPATPPQRIDGGSAESKFVVLSRETFDGARLLARAATPWTDNLGRDLVVAEIDAAQLDVLSRHVHQAERRCGGFFAFPTRPEAEAFIAHDRTAEAIALPLGGLYTIDNQATVDAWLPQVAEANIRGTIATLSAFRNRYYASTYGRQAAESIRDSWQTLANGRSDTSVELFTQCTDCSTQPSVIMTVRGAELPDEIVVVGGHLDSINHASGNSSDPQQLAPGADDDASGIATITEIIRIAMASGWQPKRTVKFMGYAAEEVGLLGSEAIANRFRDDEANVIGVLQLDMTNYKNGAPYDMQIVTDYGNTALIAYFGELFDEYLAPLGFVRSNLACNYGCSDHSSWTTAGFPSGMVFEAGKPRDPNDPWDLGDFPYIHSTGDTLANMGNSAIHSVKFAQFGIAFVAELAKTHGGGPPNQAPAASFTYTTDRMSVNFTDTSTDDDGTIASRLWDFGDGTTSAETNPVKTFTVVGTHTVALTVTDNGGLPNNKVGLVSVDNGVVLLANGAPASGLAAQQDTVQVFTLDVPEGAADLRFVLTGASGAEDADLSVSFQDQVVCESQQPDANESCAIANPPAAGTYTAAVPARTALSGFSITAHFLAPGDRIFEDGFEP